MTRHPDTGSDRVLPAGSWKDSIRSRAFVAVKVGISLGLLVLLFSRISLSEWLRRYSDIQWSYLLCGIALHQTQTAISAVKWKIILAAHRLSFGFIFLFKTYLIGNFLSLFLPTSFGGDVYRIWTISKAGKGMASEGAASVLFDRITGLFALLSIGMIGCVLVLAPRYSVMVAVFYLVAIVAFAIFTSDALIRRLPNTSSGLLKVPFRVLSSFNMYRGDGKMLARALFLSLLFQLNVVFIVTCYARALQIGPAEVSLVEMIAVVPLVFLSEVLPSINGIGVREGAFVFFLPIVGGTAAQALSLSLLILALRYVLGTVGGVLFLLKAFDRPAGAFHSRAECLPRSIGGEKRITKWRRM